MLKLNPLEIYGLDVNKRAEKFSIAVNLCEKIINSDEFENWFLSNSFTQLGEFSKFTNQELLEKLRVEINFEYYVTPRPWYKRYSSVVGWTEFYNKFIFSLGWKRIPIVTTYSDQFDGMSVSGLCGHLAHEVVAHGIGLTHEFKWSKQRDMSAPYKIGNYVEKASSSYSN